MQILNSLADLQTCKLPLFCGGGGVVGGCAHLLAACHLVVYDMEKKSPYHTVSYCVQWVALHSNDACDEFGVDGKLYVEVIRSLWGSIKMDRTMTPIVFNVGESF